MSCDICTRFACYLYSTKQCWIINSFNSIVSLVTSSSEKEAYQRREVYFRCFKPREAPYETNRDARGEFKIEPLK